MRLTLMRVVGVISLLLLAIGLITFGSLVPKLIHTIALEQMPFVKGSDSAKLFQRIPVDLTQRVYVFNITNADAFLRGAKPVFEQLGPYTFVSVWVKKMNWVGNQLVFNETKTYEFRPELSNGTLQDTVLQLDLFYMGAYELMKREKIVWIKWFIYLMLMESPLLSRHTVGELLYDGYEDLRITIAHAFFKQLPVIDGKVGYLLGKNATSDGEYSVFSGLNGTLDKLNEITKFNRSPKVPHYKEPCNKLYGTNGEQFAPYVESPPPSISIFTSQLCVPWSLYFNRTTRFNGIESAKYVSGDDLFTSSTNSTMKECLEAQPTGLKGTFDASRCQLEQNVIFSLPHFLNGDPKLRESVEGLKPDSEKHDFTLSITNLGVVTDIGIRVQINSFTSASPIDEDVPKFVFPVLWQEIIFQEKDRVALTNILWNKINKPELILQGVTFTLGAVLLLIVVLMAIRWHNLDKKREKFSSHDDQRNLVGEDELDRSFEDPKTTDTVAEP